MLVQPENEESIISQNVNQTPSFPRELFHSSQAEKSRMLLMQQMYPPKISSFNMSMGSDIRADAESFVLDVDSLINSNVEKWHVSNVGQSIPDNCVADAVAFALYMSQGLQCKPSILSITKTYNGDFYDIYAVIRNHTTFAPSTMAISVNGLVMTATKIQAISEKVAHMTHSEDHNDWLTPAEILAGYFLESLCLGCERIGHTQPQCQTSAFSCPNCKGTHSGVECDKVCRFCETYHPGKSIMFCLRQVAHYHRIHRNVGNILGSVELPQKLQSASARCFTLSSPSGSTTAGDSAIIYPDSNVTKNPMAAVRMLREYPHKVILSGLPVLGSPSSILRVVNGALSFKGKATRLIRVTDAGVKDVLPDLAEDEAVILTDSSTSMDALLGLKKLVHLGLEFIIRPYVATDVKCESSLDFSSNGRSNDTFEIGYSQ